MAQTNSASPKMTAAEMQQWIKDHDRQLQNYAAALDPIKALRDLTRGTATRRVDSLTKETIVTYLRSPISNEANIRNASWYLFFRMQGRILHLNKITSDQVQRMEGKKAIHPLFVVDELLKKALNG